jgi:hypothetical protein
MIHTVQTSMFSLLGSCSSSVLASEFGVQGSLGLRTKSRTRTVNIELGTELEQELSREKREA